MALANSRLEIVQGRGGVSGIVKYQVISTPLDGLPRVHVSVDRCSQHFTGSIGCTYMQGTKRQDDWSASHQAATTESSAGISCVLPVWSMEKPTWRLKRPTKHGADPTLLARLDDRVGHGIAI